MTSKGGYIGLKEERIKSDDPNDANKYQDPALKSTLVVRVEKRELEEKIDYLIQEFSMLKVQSENRIGALSRRITVLERKVRKLG
jgi:hypothetical protein